jgi:hypothetical protein
LAAKISDNPDPCTKIVLVEEKLTIAAYGTKTRYNLTIVNTGYATTETTTGTKTMTATNNDKEGKRHHHKLLP